MTEDFLHYIWRNELFNHEELTTSLGEEVKVIKPGEHNTHSGPDFFNSRIKIGKTTWAGNVEIHLRSSDWKKHLHHRDQSYDNVILHVVYEDDEPVFRKNGNVIPVISLKNKMDNLRWEEYVGFIENKDWIPCGSQLKEFDSLLLTNWLDRMLTQRLESRYDEISKLLEINKNNWEEVFYQRLLRNFGFNINSEPFQLLSRSLPFSCLAKHKNNLLQIEALLFGQAGFLTDSFSDDYPNELKKEFRFLRNKFNLIPLEKHLWKFLRMRPGNFPTLRIAQSAKLFHSASHMFSMILETEHVDEIKHLMNVSASSYWDNHYLFDSPSPPCIKRLGLDAIHSIIINTLVPVLFVYGIRKRDEHVKEKAIRFLEEIPSENNYIIRKWEKSGIKVHNAFHSQALLFLKNEYCSQKKCLTCGIGMKLLNK